MLRLLTENPGGVGGGAQWGPTGQINDYAKKEWCVIPLLL
jgi:hypothetical protein